MDTNGMMNEVGETAIGGMNFIQYIMAFFMQNPLYLVAGVLLMVIQKNTFQFKLGKMLNIKL